METRWVEKKGATKVEPWVVLKAALRVDLTAVNEVALMAAN